MGHDIEDVETVPEDIRPHPLINHQRHQPIHRHHVCERREERIVDISHEEVLQQLAKWNERILRETRVLRHLRTAVSILGVVMASSPHDSRDIPFLSAPWSEMYAEYAKTNLCYTNYVLAAAASSAFVAMYLTNRYNRDGRTNGFTDMDNRIDFLPEPESSLRTLQENHWIKEINALICGVAGALCFLVSSTSKPKLLFRVAGGILIASGIIT